MDYIVVDKEREDPKPGQLYYHFKKPEEPYLIIAIATDTTNGNMNCVVYQNTITKAYFTRFLEEFKDIIYSQETGTVNRFTKI